MARRGSMGVGAAISLAWLGWATTGHAAVVTLQNDGFVDGAGIGFQQGFVASEAAAVTLGPVDAPFTIDKLHFLFGPAPGSETVTVEVYLDDGGDAPGTLLYGDDYLIEGTDDAIVEIDLAGENLQVAGGSIRVALRFQHAGSPSVARDDDGSIQPGRNWIYTAGSWFDAADFGVEGDWVIRADVTTDDAATTTSGATTSSSGSTTGSSTSAEASTGAGSTTATGAGPGVTTTTGGPVCTPGETQACFGDGAGPGGQSCLADGSGWDACTCSAGEGGASGDAGESGGDDDGCGCAIPGASGAGRGAIAIAVGAIAIGLGRRRRRAR